MTLDPQVLRAAAWAALATRRVRRQLRVLPLDRVRVPDPPRLPPRAERGVHAVLRRREPSCLERSLVLQRWLAAHGERREVVVGVTSPGEFRAHAWIDGEHVEAGAAFHEVARLAP